jgi:hypothetical protein
MTGVRPAIVGGVVLAVAVLGGSTAVGDRVPRGTFEVAVLATPSAASPDEQAQELHVDSAKARHVRVADSTSASLICDECVGGAQSLQVVYAGHARSVQARNMATVWAAGCAHCSGWAVSVQVVIADSATSVTAANRAFAVNADCVHCDVSAVALQFVVVGAAADQLTAATVVRMAALRDHLATGLRSFGTSRARPWYARAADAAIGSATGQMKTLLRSDLRAPVTSHLKISHS